MDKIFLVFEVEWPSRHITTPPHGSFENFQAAEDYVKVTYTPNYARYMLISESAVSHSWPPQNTPVLPVNTYYHQVDGEVVRLDESTFDRSLAIESILNDINAGDDPDLVVRNYNDYAEIFAYNQKNDPVYNEEIPAGAVVIDVEHAVETINWAMENTLAVVKDFNFDLWHAYPVRNGKCARGRNMGIDHEHVIRMSDLNNIPASATHIAVWYRSPTTK